MQDGERIAGRHVVLLGVGHSNAHVVRMWGMNAPADTDLTCISDFPVATYSGMLPAALAGQIPLAAMEIDLVRLCASVGARLILDRVTGLDLQRREVLFEQRPPAPFDVLSIGIGSRPAMRDVIVSGDSLVPIKPMQTFFTRLNPILQRMSGRVRIAIVGAGVAGVEIACCLSEHLGRAGTAHELSLYTSAERVAPDLSNGARRQIELELQRRGVATAVGNAVIAVRQGELELADGSVCPADVVIWAAGAAPPPLAAQLGLPLDPRGFLATEATLRTVAPGLPIFAVGDSGGFTPSPLPKSGVYAVRQGPVLWENIQRLLAGRPLRPYRPQRTFLKLINLGDGRAVGQWRKLAFAGRWVLRWKMRIDQAFMDKFEPAVMADSDQPMQCCGCGCKLGGAALGAVLDALPGISAARDDAAILDMPGEPTDQGRQLRQVASLDFFSLPFHDAFLSGRVAARHAASDLIAMGASVTHALSNFVLPPGERADQERMLSDLLAGASREFSLLGARIVGGHTTVGPRAEAGFAVLGQLLGAPLQKSGLRPGDQLALTKPLGIGVLLAAHMRSRCAAQDFMALVDAMLEPQERLARAAVSHGFIAATDVTGFGLGGHLLEMLRASQVDAILRLAELPRLPGVMELLKDGVESSLAPENQRLLAEVKVSDELRVSPEFRLLADPQTCGGLLLGAPPAVMDAFLATVAEAGLRPPMVIGDVVGSGRGELTATLSMTDRDSHGGHGGTRMQQG
ncbi:MAG: selenide, water dikinase SelD [Planctomycetales bacterium]|nr:selenide, water dikinase SelD [Planctomycetales bacterium]